MKKQIDNVVDQTEKLENFLTELHLLCQKYGYGIDGCGCCNSPWVCEGKYIIGQCLSADIREASCGYCGKAVFLRSNDRGEK